MNVKRLLAAMVIPLVFFALPALSQDKVVTGKVTDSKDGSTMANATVRVKGSDVATQTDATGNFKLRVPITATTLEVSSIGYTLQDVIITDAIVFVKLSQTSEALGEVVVIGYGTVQKKDLTGSVGTIGSKDFQTGLIATPEQLIANKIPGVVVTPNGGSPGSGSTIRIRGGASLNASNDPLFVIDGIPLTGGIKDAGGTYNLSGAGNPLSTINPNDIETFTVLKDAASAAIYGSRASNGVILITTKKGRSGKPVFNFSTQLSAGTVVKKADVLSAKQFRDYVNTNGSATQKALLGTFNTDWQKEIFQTAITSDNNLSAAGAIKKVPYRVSVGYLNASGILITDKMDRVSAGINISPKFFTDHLKVDINLKGSQEETRFADNSAISGAASYDPTQGIHAKMPAYGNYFQWEAPAGTLNPNSPLNPVATLQQKQDKSTVKRSIGNIQFDYKFHFLPDLHANLNLGYDIGQGQGTVFTPSNSAQGLKAQNDNTGHAGQNNKYLQKFSNPVAEFYLNYNKDIKSINSNINATGGYGYYSNSTTTTNYPNFFSDGTMVAGTTPVFPSSTYKFVMISYYGRLIFTINNKYIFAGSIRDDGSSRFPSANRWGLFPSGSFTWKIKQESFLKNSNSLSDFNLRLSYGITGQQDGIPLYNYEPVYYMSSNTARYQIGSKFYNMNAPQKYDANLKWEQTTSYNGGIDYGFLQNRITGSVDVFYKKTKDLLSEIAVATGSNFTNRLVTNIGSMENKGVEFSINASPVKSNNWNWNVGFNVTYSTSEITNLLASKDASFIGNMVGGIAGGTGRNIQIHSVGYAPYSFYVFKQVYDSKSGKPIEGVFADLNKDGSLNEGDMYKYKQPAPKVVMGFNTQVTYKKWSVSTSLHANIGNYMYNNNAASNGSQSAILNPASYLGNVNTDLLNTGFINTNTSNEWASDYYIQNASFLKMDNAMIGYNVGKILKNKANLSVNVSCQNVFTITQYKGVDPEIFGGIDNNFYPRPRVFLLGVNLRF